MQDNLLIVSTCHLSDETTLYLACNDCLQWPMVGGPFQDTGWFFHVDEDVVADPEEPFADLYHAMEHAAAHRYSHILFYDLGSVCEELTIYRDPELEEVNGVFYSGPPGAAPHQPLRRLAFEKVLPAQDVTAHLLSDGPKTEAALVTEAN